MKKIIFTTVILMTMVFSASAQKKDSYFNWNDATDDWDRTTIDNVTFAFPAIHGSLYDSNAPLGSGLLVFTAMGAGYAIARRRKTSRKV